MAASVNAAALLFLCCDKISPKIGFGASHNRPTIGLLQVFYAAGENLTDMLFSIFTHRKSPLS
jgi:hypothetical protein